MAEWFGQKLKCCATSMIHIGCFEIVGMMNDYF